LSGGGRDSSTSGDAELRPVAGGKSQEVTIEFKGNDDPKGISFVMKSNENWYKTEDHKNFNFPVNESGRAELLKLWAGEGAAVGQKKTFGLVRTLSGTELNEPGGASITKTIFDFEGKGHVTLMHRYHQACDLLDKAAPGGAGRDTVTMLFCWLRYVSSSLYGMHADGIL